MATKKQLTEYLVLRAEASPPAPAGTWNEARTVKAPDGVTACKKAAGDGEMADPGVYWAVPIRTVKNRLVVETRTETVVSYSSPAEPSPPKSVVAQT